MTPRQSGFCETQPLLAGSHEVSSLPRIQATQRARGLGQGSFWQETGAFGTRDPKHKTVYCVASYPVKKVELKINRETAGVCARPENTFVFPFPGST